MKINLRFPRSQRVTKDQEFKRIISQGNRVRGEFLNLYTASAAKRSFGISISRKIKGSVVRNRLKRVFKEYFRLNQDKFQEKKAYLVIITKVYARITLEKAGKLISDAIIDKKRKKENK
jgi:ribonuclease P protein component